MRGTEGCNWGAIGRVHALVYAVIRRRKQQYFPLHDHPDHPDLVPSSPTSPTTMTTPILRGRVIRQSGYGIEGHIIRCCRVRKQRSSIRCRAGAGAGDNDLRIMDAPNLPVELLQAV